MDLASAPWWVGMIATPVALSASGAVAYIWKAREKVQAELRAKADAREAQERADRLAENAALREQLRVSEAARHTEHTENRATLIALLTAAKEDAGDVREAILSVKDMPTIVREGMALNLDGVKLAIREELERTSVAPPPPRERQDTQTRKRP